MTELAITKHAHACLTFTRAGRTVLVDPGAFTPNAPDLLATAEAVLVTHDHLDHLDVAAVDAALTARPDLRVFAPAAAAALLAPSLASQVSVVEPGAVLTVAGIEVRAVGGEHAVIHGDLPPMSNVGYLIEDVYHPGDSYFVPDATVETLLLPTSGPWTHVGRAADFVRAVAPRRSVQIHDAMLSDLGRGSMDMFLGAGGLTGVPLLSPAPGEVVA